ncbi:NACHT domain-containing protein [Pseudomonas lactucae]|uniref:NACHT domain-containing protein n=1 Tax=Pseudomonas lactucae TaxID=2813360 RepID=A0A9X0YDY3_9PSED|nr:hypothetical protein [Pseudomonas lactucae]MBN2977574.1 hypothetical protein [Pseudomonas lactucae]MBN2986987.1 hypothetical protein [Pseudomonas lactucae]
MSVTLAQFSEWIDVHGMPKDAAATHTSKRAGGAANARGIYFQASATAYVCLRMLQGKPVSWFKDLCAEAPVAVMPESGGPGDDIRIEFSNGITAEVQVKKGLKARKLLWEVLNALALAIHQGKLAYGILVVDPETSKAIRRDLADAIVRVSEGREVSWKGDIGCWKEQLESANIPIQSVCERIRIQIFHGTEENCSQVEHAIDALGLLLSPGHDPRHAWNTLHYAVERKTGSPGRMTSDSLVDMFTREGFALNSTRCSAALHAQYRGWVEKNHSTFSLPGRGRRLPLHSRLPMVVCRYEHRTRHGEDVQTVVKRYRAGAEGKRSSKKFDIDWLARFKRQAVIVAGPGIGKSMALTVLAHRYCVDGYFVLFVKLKQVVKTLSTGLTFKSALIDTAIGSSVLSREAFLLIDPRRWVLLADGLDECGYERDSIARELELFVSGHSGMRAVITTRVVGYETDQLKEWEHYEIIPPAKDDGPANLATLMKAVAGDDRTQEECERIANAQLHKSPASEAISTSPQLLGMSACLLLKYDQLPESRTALYIQFLRLYDQLPSTLSVENKRVAHTVLNALGWCLRQKTAVEREELEARCIEELMFVSGFAEYDAAIRVDTALSHWEKLGLIEVLRHSNTELLTFTHLSFAEFLAARHLLAQQTRLLGEVVYDPQWQEVLGYAVELGMASSLFDYLLARHEEGDPEALYQALLWCSKPGAAASEALYEQLIQASLAVLDSPTSLPESLHFKVGHGLCEIGPKASRFLMPWVNRHLESSDAALKLVAWSIASQCAFALPETLPPRLVFSELLGIYGKPFDIQEILSKRVWHENFLLQYIALLTLNACAQEEREAFSNDLLADGRLRKSDAFRLQLYKFRYEHGIREKTTRRELTLRDSFPGQRPSPEVIERYRAFKRRVERLLAGAFCTGAVQKPIDAFPQFAAFFLATKIDGFDLHEAFEGDWPEDLHSLGLTFRDFARLQRLNLVELAAEAGEILRRLETDPKFSLFNELPRVDFDADDGVQNPGFQVGLEHAKHNFLRGSRKVMFIAALVLLKATLSERDVTELLYSAPDSALACACLLVEVKHPERAVQLLVRYLQDVDCKGAECILQSLVRLQAPPTATLEALAIGYLTDNNREAVASAIDVIQSWVEKGQFSRTQPIDRALAYWKDLPHICDQSDRDICSELKGLRAAMAEVG